MLAAATLFEANSLPEFDVLNHFHYLNMHSRIFSSVLLTEMFDLRAEAQPALHFGGGGNFHEISFDDVIVLIRPWYNFSQTVTDKLSSQHF